MTTTSPPPALSSSSSSSYSSDGPYAPLPDLWNSNGAAAANSAATSSKHFPISTNSKGIFLPPLNLPSNSTSPTVSGTTTPTGSYLRSSTTPTPTTTLFGGKESSIWSNPNPARPSSSKPTAGRNPHLRTAHTTPGTPLDDGFFPAPIGSATSSHFPAAAHHGLGFNIPEAGPPSAGAQNSYFANRVSYPPSADWQGQVAPPMPGPQLPAAGVQQPQQQPPPPPPPQQQRGPPLTEENLYFATATTTPPLIPQQQLRKEPVDVNLAVNAVHQLNLNPPVSSPIGSPRPVDPHGGVPVTSGTPTPTTIPSRESPKSSVSSPSSTTTSKGPSNGKKKTTTNTDLYKTELCASFMSSGGHCPYGEKCQFAHGEKELKFIDRPPKWRSKPCQNWVKNGSCSYNARCCFRHD